MLKAALPACFDCVHSTAGVFSICFAECAVGRGIMMRQSEKLRAKVDLAIALRGIMERGKSGLHRTGWPLTTAPGDRGKVPQKTYRRLLQEPVRLKRRGKSSPARQ